jgi:hypothetical protein
MPAIRCLNAFHYTRRIPAAEKEFDESDFFNPTLPQLPSFAGNLVRTVTA